jgi:Bacterial mobilisation protein (MobC)
MPRRKLYPKSAFVRLTAHEHARLVELAKEASLSLSRFLAVSGLAGKAPSYEDRERHERAIMEVNRVGNNLNQIARQLNAQRGVINLRRVEETLLETKQALDAMRMQFGKG